MKEYNWREEREKRQHRDNTGTTDNVSSVPETKSVSQSESGITTAYCCLNNIWKYIVIALIVLIVAGVLIAVNYKGSQSDTTSVDKSEPVEAPKPVNNPKPLVKSNVPVKIFHEEPIGGLKEYYTYDPLSGKYAKTGEEKAEKELTAEDIASNSYRDELNEMQKAFQTTCDFFLNNFNYKSYDNQNGVCRTFYPWRYCYNGGERNGQCEDADNACCANIPKNGKFQTLFCFGVGNTNQDTVAHEFMHAVTGHNINNGRDQCLIYYGDSGALNEAFSDIFACLIHIEANPEMPTDERWIYANGQRNLAHPTDNMPEYYLEEGRWRTDGRDWGGVHHNMSVICKMAYLLCEGGDFRNQHVAAMGTEKVKKLFWQIVTGRKISINQSFRDIADRIISCASDAGFSESEINNVRKACLAVNLPVSGGMNAKNAFLSGNVCLDFRFAKSGSMMSNKYIVSADNFRQLFTLDEISNVSVSDIDTIGSRNRVYQTNQSIGGIPVFASSATAQTGSNGKMLFFSKNFSVSAAGYDFPKPKPFPDQLRQSLLGGQSHSPAVDMIYDPALLHRKGKPMLVWQVDAGPSENQPTHRYLIDQATGKVVFDYPLVIID